MCGIVFACSHADASPDPVFDSALAALIDTNKARGPDSHVSHRTTTSTGKRLHFFSSVLHLRGPSTFAQPVVDPQTADVFLWNGQVFDGLAEDEAGQSDTAVLWERFAQTRRTRSGQDAVRDVLAAVEGPWASLYYDASAETLFVSRDPLGRRSLLISHPTPARPHLVIASASCAATADWDWQEIPAEGLHKFDFRVRDLSQRPQLETVSRQPSNLGSPFTVLHPVNTLLPPPAYLEPVANPSRLREDDPTLNSAADDLITQLTDSVRRRVDNIPSPALGQARLGVLFSGGIDCTVIALLASSFIPADEPIDLLNVAFENPRALANAAAEAARSGRGKKGKGRAWDGGGTHTEEGSGAVEAPMDVYDVPDRATGREALVELRRLRPNRVWRFVEVDVPYSECQQHTPHVLDLMVPSNTVMDLSLALALYFASRGVGHVQEGEIRQRYESKAKVLLTGLGADEQLGGYARHRRAYEQGGWVGVIQEIQLDIDRLPTRNLGRDDRIVSSHGVETRYPYLSLSFLAHTAALPIHLKVDYRLPEPRVDGAPAWGDKMLLRLAALRLGLAQTAGRKKRAMQFGARSAKMEVEETKRGAAGRKGWGAEALRRKAVG